MLLSIVKRREVIEPLMWSLLIIKVDPCLSHLQKLPQRIIGATISDSQLEDADKAFRMPLSVGVPARLMESDIRLCARARSGSGPPHIVCASSLCQMLPSTSKAIVSIASVTRSARM